MLRFLGALFALLFVAGPAAAATMVCRAPLYPDKNWSDVSRFIESDGRFSFETYYSKSAPGFDPVLWRYSSPRTSANGQLLRLEIDPESVRKLKKGSFVEISDGLGRSLEARRQYADTRTFDVPLDSVIKTFGKSGTLTLKLINGRAAGKDPFTGKLDLAQLSNEAALIPAAQQRLDALQADFMNQCKPIIEPEPEEDAANWSCTNSANDSLGSYYADGDQLGLTLRLGDAGSIQWYTNSAGPASLYWSDKKVARSLTKLRLQNGTDVLETVEPLPRAKYVSTFSIDWPLAKAMQLQNDMLIQALDEKGAILAQATIPKATMEHATKQIRLMQMKSIEDRKNYQTRCEEPMEIIVT